MVESMKNKTFLIAELLVQTGLASGLLDSRKKIRLGSVSVNGVTTRDIKATAEVPCELTCSGKTVTATGEKDVLPKGWKCPTCDRVNAPGVMVCPCFFDRPHRPTKIVPGVYPNDPWNPVPWEPPYSPWVSPNKWPDEYPYRPTITWDITCGNNTSGRTQ